MYYRYYDVGGNPRGGSSLSRCALTGGGGDRTARPAIDGGGIRKQVTRGQRKARSGSSFEPAPHWVHPAEHQALPACFGVLCPSSSCSSSCFTLICSSFCSWESFWFPNFIASSSASCSETLCLFFRIASLKPISVNICGLCWTEVVSVDRGGLWKNVFSPLCDSTVWLKWDLVVLQSGMCMSMACVSLTDMESSLTTCEQLSIILSRISHIQEGPWKHM